MSDGYAIPWTGYASKARKAPKPPADELEDDAPTWRDVLRANADFPGAYLRFLGRMGYPCADCGWPLGDSAGACSSCERCFE